MKLQERLVEFPLPPLAKEHAPDEVSPFGGGDGPTLEPLSQIVARDEVVCVAKSGRGVQDFPRFERSTGCRQAVLTGEALATRPFQLPPRAVSARGDYDLAPRKQMASDFKYWAVQGWDALVEAGGHARPRLPRAS